MLRDPARHVLDRAAASALSAAEIKQLLVKGAARTAAQIELIEAALPARLEWRALVDGVRITYAEARRARRAAKRSRHAFHTWRRRSKELVIQLDMLGRIAGPAVEQLRDRITAATADLGDAVDLLMVRDFVRVYGAEIDATDLDTLADALVDRLDAQIRARRGDARDAFRKKPRTIAHKLAKAFRRDTEQAAAPPSIRGEEFALT